MVVLLVAMLILVMDMASDIYLPSLPTLPDYFDTNISMAQMTISVYLLGLTLSTIFYGVLGDIYGRKKIIVLGLSIFVVASLLCYISNNIYLFLITRMVQGIGGGVGVCLGYACISDVYSGIRCSQIISRIGILISLSPAIGPIIGGFIAYHYGWKTIFLINIIISAALLVVFICFFIETFDTKNIVRTNLKNMFIDYLVILKKKSFILNVIIMAFTFSNLWVEITYTPFLFDSMGITYTQYGVYVSIMVLFYIIGANINQFVVRRLGIPKSLLLGALIMSSGDIILMLLTNTTSTLTLTPLILTAAWSWSAIGLAFIISNSIAGAMEILPKSFNARGSALIFAIQTASGTAGIQICTFITKDINYDIFLMLAISSSCTIVSAMTILLSNTQTANKQPYLDS